MGSIRTRINELIRDENTDPGVVGALGEMQNVIDEAVQANLSGEDAAAYRRVRAEYRNFLPLERAKSSRSQGTAEGVINPAQLQTGIKGAQGRREVAAGEGEMTDLAEAGGTVMETPRSSGTAENLRAQLAGLLPLAASGIGVGGSLMAELPAGATTGVGAGLGLTAAAVPMLRDAFVRSGVGQRIMSRQGPRIPIDRGGLAAILTAARNAQMREQGDIGRR
jgi:hypothetical protein